MVQSTARKCVNQRNFDQFNQIYFKTDKIRGLIIRIKAFRRDCMNAGKTVLIVDMDHSSRVTLRLALESAGYEVVSATHWRGGLKVLSLADKPALIFLDVAPPLEDGDEFIKVVKSDIALAEIPIIVTATSISVDEITWAAAFLQKPFDPDHVKKIAHAHC
jgi:two-component system chemotaxis response regulator CheY